MATLPSGWKKFHGYHFSKGAAIDAMDELKRKHPDRKFTVKRASGKVHEVFSKSK